MVIKVVFSKSLFQKPIKNNTFRICINRGHKLTKSYHIYKALQLSSSKTLENEGYVKYKYENNNIYVGIYFSQLQYNYSVMFIIATTLDWKSNHSRYVYSYVSSNFHYKRLFIIYARARLNVLKYQ